MLIAAMRKVYEIEQVKREIFLKLRQKQSESLFVDSLILFLSYDIMEAQDAEVTVNFGVAKVKRIDGGFACDGIR